MESRCEPAIGNEVSDRGCDADAGVSGAEFGEEIQIDGQSNVGGLKFCNHCGSAIQVTDIVEVLEKVL